VTLSLYNAEATPSADKGVSTAWRKSTRSVTNGQCVEAATLADGQLAVRDSVDKNGPIAKFTQGEWRTFLKGVKDGNFDTI
jgi:Domain of unknown function (DUF397)